MNPMKLFVLLITLIALEPTHVIGFGPIESVVFDNTTGTPDTRFKQEIGASYTGIVLLEASDFFLKTFRQTYGGGKNYTSIDAIIESFRANGIGWQPLQVAITGGNQILLNADYVQAYIGDVKAEFTGILLTSGWPSKGWVAKGSGSRWDEGYAVTAYFLEYCNGLRDGFIADLNAMMRYYYSDAFFVQLLGKSVYELWDDYKLQSAPAPAPGSGC
ncbi:uncharacterized protein LOC115688071 [Syzygium oleosum]|uniref:uncharacterized protein LOC115688071 n=1 Tax=Syzygium oleosum TaxID=219896 RepID=UPI0011D223EA|nr:uncharacterized protein LOC115688071 [Syzygium oleosum]